MLSGNWAEGEGKGKETGDKISLVRDIGTEWK
jgi:hypothetical protein